VTLRVAVVGHGRTGSEVAIVLRERGHDAVLVGRSDPFPSDCPVGIDFTRGGEVLGNLDRALGKKACYVVGTTGFDLEAARARVEAEKGGFVYAPNFSLGVNLFYRMVRDAARTMAGFSDYDPYVLERHHRGKRDFPSGTAKALARILEAETGRRGSETLPLEEAFHVASLRSGGIVGDHTVGFSSGDDEIVLEHRSRSRRGFALGAVLAAEWVVGRTGVYSFEDVLTALGNSPPRGVAR
jgi:4-hydroxy-tetrahydrodipicolinate reductase